MSGFGAVDWAVVGGFLALTTLLGERLAGRQATLRDYFLGGRRLPWWAVAGSIVATEVSAITFVSLPFVVFRDGGDLTYLQLGVFGLLIARLIVGYALVPRYFERELYSPYDLVGERLGVGARRAASALFSAGGVLAQASRVYLTAVVLEVLLHGELAALEQRVGVPPLAASVAAIGAVSVVWTWLGGMATVIWTDAMLFVVFLVGIAISIATATAGVDGGAAEVLATARDAGKLRLLDFDTDPAKAYTFWAALFAYTIWGVGAFGTDQLLAQRLFCCRDARDARRAIVASNAALVVTALAALLGMALFAYYQAHPLEGEALALYEEKGDRIFPIFILEAVPTGLRGLIVAGVFAAAISSLDSILAALSQTALATVVPERLRSVRTSRVLVVVFGVLLCVLAVQMERAHARYPSILDLALAMAGYTVGALLAGVLLALWPGGRDGRGYAWSAPLAAMTVVAVAWHTSASRTACAVFAAALVVLGLVRLRDARVALLAAGGAGLVALSLWDGLRLAWPWNAPIGLAVAYGFGWLLSKPAPYPAEPSAPPGDRR
ncbi:MAG: hypothetical protein AAF682_24890 [Planctomycetota bacterium]